MLGSEVMTTRRQQGRIGSSRRIEAGLNVTGRPEGGVTKIRRSRSVAMTARTQGGDTRIHQRPEERLTQGVPQSWRLTWMDT